jgi:hypothetical protein
MPAFIENEAAYDRAIKRNIIANAQKTFERNTPDSAAILGCISDGRRYDEGGYFLGYTDNFIGSLASAYDSFGKLSPAQCEAVRKIVAKQAERRLEWDNQQAALNAARQHIGAIGEKITITVTLKKCIAIDTMYGTSFINILEDASRNVIIYKGNSQALYGVNEGDIVTLAAVVKDHGVRDGVKQTVIARPKQVV